MKNQKNIWMLQNEILEKIKEEVKHLIGYRPPLLRKYYNDYKKIFKRYISLSNHDELIADIMQSDIVYCGDYHTLKEAQLTNIELLHKIIPKRQKIIIAMEAFLSKHQPYIDQFMQNKLTTEEFLSKINYKKTFGFNWDNYEPIINFAKKHDLQIIGLDTQPIDPKVNLTSRDKNSAKIIARYSKLLPDFLIWVIIGDLHLAPNHLPKATEYELAKKNLKRRQLIIYQNSETLYKMLVKKELVDKIEVIKVRKNAYCIMNTPPWLKYQSYIHWIEYGENIPKKYSMPSIEYEEVDLTDDIAALVVSLSDFLNIKSDDLLDFTVYTPSDISFLNLFPRKSYNYRIYKKQMINLQNFVIPDKKILYLSKISIDCMSEVAAMHIYHQLSKTPACLSNSPSDFYARIIIKILSIFFSKIINYKRLLPSLEQSVHDSFKSKNSQTSKTTLSYVLLHESITIPFNSHKEINKSTIEKLNEISIADYNLCYPISDLIGKIYADKLYNSYLNKPSLINQIKSLFFIQISNLDVALKIFFKLRNLSYK